VALLCPSLLTPLSLPSFPTRRSSDLYRRLFVAGGCFRLSRLRLLIYDIIRTPQASFLVALPAADDIPGFFEFLYRFADCVDLFRSEEHTSELQSRFDLVCRLLLEKKK